MADRKLVRRNTDGGTINAGPGSQARVETANTGPPATWFDTLPHPEVADRAADCLEELLGADAGRYLERAGGDRRFALWMHLVDHHLAGLPAVPGAGAELPWRTAYDACWSPYLAAFAAWAGDGHRPDVLENLGLVTPGRGPAIA
jgi:hypothetical protein